MIRTATLWNCPGKTNGKQDFISVYFIFICIALFSIIISPILPIFPKIAPCPIHTSSFASGLAMGIASNDGTRTEVFIGLSFGIYQKSVRGHRRCWKGPWGSAPALIQNVVIQMCPFCTTIKFTWKVSRFVRKPDGSHLYWLKKMVIIMAMTKNFSAVWMIFRKMNDDII